MQFSRNGKYLASSSNDRSAIIWEVRLIFDRPRSMVVLTRDYYFSYVNYSFSAVIFLLCLFSGFNKLYDFLAFLFYLWRIFLSICFPSMIVLYLPWSYMTEFYYFWLLFCYFLHKISHSQYGVAIFWYAQMFDSEVTVSNPFRSCKHLMNILFLRTKQFSQSESAEYWTNSHAQVNMFIA